MSSEHPKVPATPANCEADHQDKLKLNKEFEEFKKLIENKATLSPEVQELIVPLKKLEKAVLVAAHGRFLVAVEDEKKKYS